MKNPYTRTVDQGHHLDLEAMRVLCFDIHNIVAASSTLIGSLELMEPDELSADSALRKLHYELSEPLLSKRLLHLAIMLRAYDDSMKDKDVGSAYAAHAQSTSGSDFVGHLAEKTLSLREACNKIIHASGFRPIYEKVYNEHGSPSNDPVGWTLTGEVELTGVQNGEPWEAMLHLQEFIETALDRISFEPRKDGSESDQ